MNGTEEIRFRVGDACCSISDQGMTWALSEHVHVIGYQPLQGRTREQDWDGPRKCGSFFMAMVVLS